MCLKDNVRARGVVVLMVLEVLMVLVRGINERGLYPFRLVMAPKAIACLVFVAFGSRRKENHLLGSESSCLILLIGLKIG